MDDDMTTINIQCTAEEKAEVMDILNSIDKDPSFMLDLFIESHKELLDKK